MDIRFGLLGALSVEYGGRRIPITSAKQRSLLAALLLRPNRWVAAEWLTNAIWGGSPPSSASGLVRTYMWRLRDRACCEHVRISSQSGGYMLRLEPGELDVDRFVAGAARGRALLAEGKFEEAERTISAAVDEWRGDVLQDTPVHGDLRVDVEYLKELRLAAVEDGIDAELGLGWHSTVIPRLTMLVKAYPLRERFTAQLMVALYRSERRAEALAAYANVDRLLRDDFGIDPGPRLRELHSAILGDDESRLLP